MGERVALIDIDNKYRRVKRGEMVYPNLALMKISSWHKAMGNSVGFDIINPTKIYVSCIFEKYAGEARGIAKLYPDIKIDIGGSGISLTKTLPDEIEQMKPDYDLYPSTYSQDFTTRGCIRKCGFCIVPKKEGKIRINKHPSEFHEPRFDTCMIMDNNLFAAPDHWQTEVFQWFIENKIKMLSPQGWDIRLLTEERAKYLKAVRHSGIIHFAWDNLNDEKVVKRGIQILRNTGFNLKHDISFYVLSGFNTTFNQDVYRCNTLRSLGVNSFVMPYQEKKTKEVIKLMKWCRPAAYWSNPFIISDIPKQQKKIDDDDPADCTAPCVPCCCPDCPVEKKKEG